MFPATDSLTDRILPAILEFDSEDGVKSIDTFEPFGVPNDWEPVGSEVVPANVPLFTFGSPPVIGCKVVLGLTASSKASLGAKLKLFGNGYDIKGSLKVTLKSKVTAADGLTQQVYVPVALEVQYFLEHFNDGREVRPHTRVGWRPDLMALNSAGVKTVSSVPPKPNDHDIFHLDLSGDQGSVGQEQTITIEAAQSAEFSLGFKISEVDQAITASVETTQSLEVTATLTPGHDYKGLLGRSPWRLNWITR